MGNIARFWYNEEAVEWGARIKMVKILILIIQNVHLFIWFYRVVQQQA